MEIIKNYLDSMFANLPVNQEMIKLKEDLYNNMEDKYMELKADGHSENEAIGTVIANFGNIDELFAELGIGSQKKETVKARKVGQTEAETIIKDKRFWGKIIGIGVSLCIIAPGVLVLLSGLTNNVSFGNFNLIVGNDINSSGSDIGLLSLLSFFIVLAMGIGTIIVGGLTLEKYNFLQKEVLEVSTSAKNYIQQRKSNYQTRFTLHIVIGIMLCILSPMFLIIVASLGNPVTGVSTGAAVLLFMVALAVYLFVSAGTEMDTYKQLLQEEDYKPENKQENKIVSAVAAVIWPLTVIVYLVWSFTTGSWAISWIIWPVVGIAFGAFSAVVSIITKE